MRCLLILCLIASPFTNAVASEDHQNGAKRLWASYYCSVLARMSDDDETQARLIKAGTDVGRLVVAAVDNGEADAFLIGKDVPGFIFSQRGVSVDFQLGSLWMSAEETAVKDVLKKVPEVSEEPLAFKKVAKEEFKLRNCDLL